jgi:hypothetical protein
MSRCRVARRVVSVNRRQNACVSAENGVTLATKDMHCSVQLFSIRGVAAKRLVVLVGRRVAVSTSGRGDGAAGVRLLGHGGARRAALGNVRLATPCIYSSLATKEKTVKEMA